MSPLAPTKQGCKPSVYRRFSTLTPLNAKNSTSHRKFILFIRCIQEMALQLMLVLRSSARRCQRSWFSFFRQVGSSSMMRWASSRAN